MREGSICYTLAGVVQNLWNYVGFIYNFIDCWIETGVDLDIPFAPSEYFINSKHPTFISEQSLDTNRYILGAEECCLPLIGRSMI